jgi:uncharacterized membrane protein YeiB
VGQRIRGVDLARGLAVLGMVMVHFGPVGTEGFGLVGAAYRAPHGRASILFVLVAGVGVSLLAGDRGPARLRDASWRLAWRAVVLAPLGLALATLPTDVAVILHFYALYLCLGIVCLRLPDRLLLWLAAVSALLGPVVVLISRQSRPEWFSSRSTDWTDVEQVAAEFIVSGRFPIVVWAAPLFVGMWIGRQDLHSSKLVGRLTAVGVLIAAGAFGVERLLRAQVQDPVGGTDWRQLATLEPHSQMPLWIVSSTGIALAVLGGCVLGARAVPRLVWPLVALGQQALSIYVAHILVLADQPELLKRGTFSEAWWSVGRFAIVVLLLATAWRAIARRGPVEAFLHLPWWVTGRLRTLARPALADDSA